MTLTPREKALELIEQVEEELIGHNVTTETIIKLALIPVNSILQLHKKTTLEVLYYYKEVEKEILNY